MSILPTHAPQDALLGQPRQTTLLQDLPLRNFGLSTSSTAVPFSTLLLQQLMGALDRTAMTLDEAEPAASTLATPWASLHALAQAGHQLPDQAPARSQADHRHPASVADLVPTHHPHRAQRGSGPPPAPSGLVAEQALTAPPSPGPVPPPISDADGFLGKLEGIAQATAGALGLSPHLLLAQAALETGWGRKAIKAVTGQESFNLFGMKAGRHWTGETVEVKTTEYINGIQQKKVESFRAYSSYAESFADYAKLIKHRYGTAIAQGATAEGFGQALQAKGYATDPNYAQKIAWVAQSVAYRLAALP